MGLMRGQMAAVKKENARLVESAQQQAERFKITEEMAAEDEAKTRRLATTAKYLVLGVRVFINENGGNFPATLEEVAKAIGDRPGLEDIKQFELVPYAQKYTELEHPEQVVLLKGGLFQTASGTWGRLYGMADGAVYSLTSKTQDFRDEEKRLNFIYPPVDKPQQ